MAERPVVIVTGSSGLIGFSVIRRLAGMYTMVGFDRVGPPEPPPAADAVGVDLTSDESTRQGLAHVRETYGTQIASVVHLAAYYDFSGEPSPLYDELTVRGTQRLLRELRDFEVGQFLFSSTMLVHKPCVPGQRIDENAPLLGKWDYPRSKIHTEHLILAGRGQVPVVLMRIAGVYNEQCHSVPLAHQMQRIHEKWLMARVFPGSTAHGQAFIHLDDAVEAIALAVEKRAALPRETILLIGEDRTLSYDELQHTFARLIHGEDFETQQIPKAVAKTGAWLQDQMPGEEPFIKPWMIDLADDHYELDITRAEQLLGWKPRHNLRDVLPAMVAYLKEKPVEFYAVNKLEGKAAK